MFVRERETEREDGGSVRCLLLPPLESVEVKQFWRKEREGRIKNSE